MTQDDAAARTDERKRMNAWGIIGVVIAVLALIIDYLNMNSTAVFEAIVGIRSEVTVAFLINLVKVIPYAPVLFGVIGLALARRRERVSSCCIDSVGTGQPLRGVSKFL